MGLWASSRLGGRTWAAYLLTAVMGQVSTRPPALQITPAPLSSSRSSAQRFAAGDVQCPAWIAGRVTPLEACDSSPPKATATGSVKYILFAVTAFRCGWSMIGVVHLGLFCPPR